MSTFAYTAAPGAVTVNFYEASTLQLVAGGVRTQIVQETRYPLDGKVLLTVAPERPVPLELRLRIPAWCKSYRAALKGKPSEVANPAGDYLTISRLWQKGDTVEIEFAMPAVVVEGTHTNRGLVAIHRGPLVLAFDARLNPGLSAASVSPAAGDDGTWPCTLAAADGRMAHVFAGHGLTLPAAAKVPLRLTSFAEAGSEGGPFAVWLPAPPK